MTGRANHGIDLMLSLLTNTAATTALAGIRATQSALEKVQREISTGSRVNAPGDDPVAWSIKHSTTADVASLGAARTAFGASASVLSTASNAVTTSLAALVRMKADVSSLQSGTTTGSAAQQDFAAQQKALASILGAASFGGTNILDGSSPTNVEIPGGVSRDDAGGIAIATITIATAGSGGTQVAGYGGPLAASLGTFSDASVQGTAGSGTHVASYAAGSILAIDLTNASSTDLATIAAGLTTAISQVTSVGNVIAGKAATVSAMSDYAASLSDALSSGVGSMVDADMNADATRLQALQTQEQLAVQSLGIANGQDQLVLRLFGIA